MKALFTFLLSLTGFYLVTAYSTIDKEDCDVCSTSSSSTSINFDFNNQNHIGLLFLYQNYKTYNGIFNNSKKFQEHYRTLQLTGNLMINQNWNVTWAVPVHVHNRILEDNSLKQNESGLGDIALQSTYQLFQSDSTSQTKWKLYLGGGIKAPTAEFKERDGQTSNPNFNLGSGAWDYSLISRFNIKLNQSGINTQLTYTFKSKNTKHFQFGNQTEVSILYFKTININSKQPFQLFTGLKSEFYSNNKQYGYVIDNSKGYIHNLQLGGNIPFKKLNLGCMAYIPIKQNLMNERINSKFKTLLYLNWNF